MIEAFVFDIDNTLYSYDSAHKAAFGVLSDWAFTHLGLEEAAFRELHRLGDRLLRKHTGRPCAAIHNRLIRYQLMLEQLGQPISLAPVMENLYWGTLHDHMEAAPGAYEAIAALKAAGCTIGIGTDMTASHQFVKLERLGLLELFDFMVTSEEAGAEKPDEAMFRLCAEKAGCAPDACAFVGDSVKKDILGASAAGMLPVWFCPDDTKSEPLPQGAVRIRSLSELTGLLSDSQ